jgi:hypothetical protein
MPTLAMSDVVSDISLPLNLRMDWWQIDPAFTGAKKPTLGTSIGGAC